ncbi:hypothetical protein RJT34_18121 [Clitoria ternatea]|uniref:Uncharacterized protein n=1 Tax=Clitoria ternatea TaxID=43366 RepID=A0AAN9JBP6_CLITE
MPWCPCFGSDDPVADRDPVLLVTGMGGSIVHSKPKGFGFTMRVWVRLLLADLEFRKKIWSVYNPRTGYTEILDKNSQLIVPQDDHGLYAIDILDPSWFTKCIHLTEVYLFHDMIDMLVDCGYKKGTTLFGYGYDFRQSNRTDKLMEGLKGRLETAYKASGGRKVNLISHSMGGILILCFMIRHRDLFTKYVNKWICMACPFQGAPGCINDSLLTGLQFVDGFQSYFFVSRWSMHQLLVECPSIYEMLPNPNYEWKKPPKIQVWRKHSKDGHENINLESYGPVESVSLFEEALRNNQLNYNGKMVPVPFNLAILEWASETRKLISNAKLPDGVSFYNIYGTSLDTPYDVCYGSEKSPIVELSEVCHTMPQYTYVEGDGTVPTESAMADGLEAKERVGVPAAHREILRNTTAFEHIKKWLGAESMASKQSKTSKVVDADLIKPVVV